MANYLATMTQASESLKLAGNPISFDDLMSYVLAGLDAEYISIVCTIWGKNITTGKSWTPPWLPLKEHYCVLALVL